MVVITQLSNAVSDLFLGSFGLVFGYLILKNRGEIKTRLFWGWAVTITGVCAWLGTITHGGQELISGSIINFLTLLTTIFVGLAVSLMIYSASYATKTDVCRKRVQVVAVGQFIIFSFIMIFISSSFDIVGVDFVLGMLFIGFLFNRATKQFSINHGNEVYIGVAVTLFAVALNLIFRNLLNRITADDIFHYTEIVGLYFFYRAGINVQDVEYYIN